MSTEKPLQEIQNVDTVIHAKWLVPMTQKNLILENFSLAINGEKIHQILPASEMKASFKGRQEFHLEQHHVLMPGLINAHGHAPMTLMRGYADDMPLNEWLEQRIWPAESKWVSEEFVKHGAELAIAEMLKGGITSFFDMYFFPDVVANVALSANIRALLASPVLDFPTVWAQDAEEYIHKATALYDQFKNSKLLRIAFGPHAPYTVSDAPLQKISMLASELDIPVHIHVHENQAEISSSLDKYRMRPLKRLEQLGLVSPNLHAVHLTQVEPDEIDMLAQANATVVHCPASNLKLANGFCKVKELLDAGINVSLGTDGAASNNELNMLNEMRLAALLGKATSGNAAALDAWQVMQMATINGARAMGMEDQLGSLQVGKLADLATFDLNDFNSIPVNDPVSAMVYSVQSRQCSHVWVGGKLNVENGELLSIDQAALQAAVERWRKSLADS